jgi:hypothetical protein
MLGRNAIEVSLAKPLSDKRKQAQVKREQRKPFDQPFNSSRSGFGGDTSPGRGPPPSGNFGGFSNNPPRGGGRSDGSFSSYLSYIYL